jgi:hypothetical protein
VRLTGVATRSVVPAQGVLVEVQGSTVRKWLLDRTTGPSRTRMSGIQYSFVTRAQTTMISYVGLAPV